MKLARVYKRVFETKDGKAILADMMRESGWKDDVFNPGQPDVTAYFLGMQRLVKRALNFTEMDDKTALRIVKSAEVTVNE